MSNTAYSRRVIRRRESTIMPTPPPPSVWREVKILMFCAIFAAVAVCVAWVIQ